MPTTLTISDKSLTTTLKPIDRDAFGKKIKDSYHFERLNRWQQRSKFFSQQDRNLVQASSELNRIADNLSLPAQIREIAAYIYRKAIKENLIQGRSIEAMVAACVYAAIRSLGLPRTLKEIFKVSRASKKEIKNCYNLLIEKLNIKPEIPNPIKFLEVFSKKINVSPETQRRAIEILYLAKGRNMWSGPGREGLAAGALYIACLENGEKIVEKDGILVRLTQKLLAEIANVTEVTIRNHYQKLKKELKL